MKFVLHTLRLQNNVLDLVNIDGQSLRYMTLTKFDQYISDMAAVTVESLFSQILFPYNLTKR